MKREAGASAPCCTGCGRLQTPRHRPHVYAICPGRGFDRRRSNRSTSVKYRTSTVCWFANGWAPYRRFTNARRPESVAGRICSAGVKSARTPTNPREPLVMARKCSAVLTVLPSRSDDRRDAVKAIGPISRARRGPWRRLLARLMIDDSIDTATDRPDPRAQRFARQRRSLTGRVPKLVLRLPSAQESPRRGLRPTGAPNTPSALARTVESHSRACARCWTIRIRNPRSTA